MKQPESSSANQNIAHDLAREGIYSRVPEVNALLIDTFPALQKAGFIFIDAKPIDYGSRITVSFQDTEICFNIYYSRKKGFSVVCPRGVNPGIAEKVKSIFSGKFSGKKRGGSAAEKALSCWIGSDEAGKGDFLGPLVVVAFRMDTSMKKDLKTMGVKDSKNLGNTECRRIARKLYVRFKESIGVVELIPETYNRLYVKFREQGKGLNWILGWAHAKAIEKVLTDQVEGIIVDKFAAESLTTRRLDTSAKWFFRHRAEDNPAVAAASILARARYLYRLEKLSQIVGVKLAPGAGARTDKSAVEAVKKQGKEILQHIAKVHFKNMDKVMAAIETFRR